MQPPDGGSVHEPIDLMARAVSRADRADGRHWARRLAIFIVPVLLFLALAAWAVATPLGSSPDEDFHLSSTWCGLGDRAGLCEPGSSDKQEQVPAPLITIACFKGAQDKSADCQHLDDTHLAPTTRVNATGIYPPIYYAVTGIFASRSLAASVIVIRLFNAALFIAFGTALFALLPRERRASLVLTWVGAVVPLGLFLVPSANPSSWAITGSVSAWFAGIGFFESAGRRKIWFGALAALACLLSAGSRADAAVYSVLAVCAAWFLTRRTQRRRRFSAFLLPAAVVVVGLVFVLFSKQSASVLQGVGDDTDKAAPHGFDLLFHNLTNVPMLWVGTLGSGPLGSLGWFDVPLPYATQAGAFAAFLGVLAWGLRDGAMRHLVVMGLWVAVLIAVPLWVLQQSHESVGTYLQPRYLYPGVLLFAAAATTVRRHLLRLSTAQLAALGAASVLAASTALYATIRRFSVADPSSQSFDLSDPQKWWWGGAMPGPMMVWILGSLLFAVAVAAALAGVAQTSRSVDFLRISPRISTRTIDVPSSVGVARHAARRRTPRFTIPLPRRRPGQDGS